MFDVPKKAVSQEKLYIYMYIRIYTCILICSNKLLLWSIKKEHWHFVIQFELIFCHSCQPMIGEHIDIQINVNNIQAIEQFFGEILKNPFFLTAYKYIDKSTWKFPIFCTSSSFFSLIRFSRVGKLSKRTRKVLPISWILRLSRSVMPVLWKSIIIRDSLFSLAKSCNKNIL